MPSNSSSNVWTSNVWTCSECNLSPLSFAVDSHCPDCGHRQCSDCEMYRIMRKDGNTTVTSNVALSNVQSTKAFKGARGFPAASSESQGSEPKVVTASSTKENTIKPRLLSKIPKGNIDLPELRQEDTAITTSRDTGYGSMASKSMATRRSNKGDSESVAFSGSQSITTSSLNPAAEGGATEEFANILLGDNDIRRSVELGFAKMVPDLFGRNFTRLLEGFAIDLRKEARSGIQNEISQFIRTDRAYVTSLIRKRSLGLGGDDSQVQAFDDSKAQEASKITLERHLAQNYPAGYPKHVGMRPEDNQESDDDSLHVSEDGQHIFSNVEMVTDFLLSSTAFMVFKTHLRDFVGLKSGLLPENSLVEGTVHLVQKWERQEPLKRVKNTLKRVFRPPVRLNFKRVEWICGCGDLLYMDFNINSSGSLQTIEALENNQSTTSRPSGDTQPPMRAPSGVPSNPVAAHFGGAQNPPSQQSSVFGVPGTLNPRSSGLWTSGGPAARSNAAQELTGISFLELCVNTGQTKSLAEINTSAISTDGEFFHKVKEHYVNLRSFRARLWLLKPARVSWVRFSVENHHRVGILHKPYALPPKSEVDERRYTYHPCPLEEELPIDPDVFIHYVFCSIACPRLIWLPRIPRRLNSIFASNDNVAFGWGAHIDERPHLGRILLLNIAFIAGSIIAAILWDHFKGDFQGAIGLASLIVMLLNTIMFYYILRWNEE